MITPQIITPRLIARREERFGRLKSAATSEPVHAPVPGRGIATNIISAINAPPLSVAFCLPLGEGVGSADG